MVAIGVPPSGSVAVDNFDILGTGRCPGEADPPLLVDADAVLTGAIPSKGFQSVPGWDSQVVEGVGGVQHSELAQGGPFDAWVEPLGTFA
jgi:hypothetical protein